MSERGQRESFTGAIVPSLGFVDVDDYARARDVLLSAGYSDQALLERVGLPTDSLEGSAGASLALARVDSGSPLETLILLFVFGVAVPAPAARRAVSPMPLDRWIGAGLVALDGDQVLPRVRLVPLRGLWLAYDRRERKQCEDFVMGVGTSTVTLMDVAVRRSVEAMLDLGCGCGTQGFFSAPHARAVVATDSNPRALQFVRFNARLNGLRHVQDATGDLFAPVAGRRFGLVLSNPPFVITPESRYIYRDGGLEGDAFCRRLVREVPEVIEEGGFCQLLCSWAHYRGEDWKRRLAAWFERTGCDAWVMCTRTEDAAVYAEKWIRETESEDHLARKALFGQWMDYYRRLGIEKISSGVIHMRRRSVPANWLRLDESPPRITGPCGDEIERRFLAFNALEAAADDALLQLRPCVSPAVRLGQSLRAGNDAWEMEGMCLRLEGPLADEVRVDAIAAGLVSRCSGSRSLRELADGTAAAMGLSPEAITPAILGLARDLIAKGFLLPSQPAGS